MLESSCVVDVIECVMDGWLVSEDEILENALCLVASTSLCLWQKNKKWFVVSMVLGQFGQYGDAAFLIQ